MDEKLKALIEEGLREGYVTYEKFNEVFPEDDTGAESLDEIFAMLDDQGIELRDERESGGEATETAAAPAKPGAALTERLDSNQRLEGVHIYSVFPGCNGVVETCNRAAGLVDQAVCHALVDGADVKSGRHGPVGYAILLSSAFEVRGAGQKQRKIPPAASRQIQLCLRVPPRIP